jgi:flagellar biosynthesis protein FlhG
MSVTPTATPSPVASGSVPMQHATGKVVAITSGKGGVGKTFLSANLAAALTRFGLKVLVLDADLGLANLDVVLNLYPKFTLHDVFAGKVGLDDAIVKAPGGFSVLLAGSGLVEYSRLTPEVRADFMKLMSDIVPRFDVVLLDTGAGISDVVLFALSLASEILLVATPEPTSLTDAYATIKVLAAQQQRQQVRLIVNQAVRPGDGKNITAQLQQVLNRFMVQAKPAPAAPGTLAAPGRPIRLIHMGDIPADQAVKDAVMRRQLLMLHAPGSPAAIALGLIAGRLQDTVIMPDRL